MVIEDFENRIVFLDTSPLIYFIEGNSEYQERLKKIFKLNDESFFKFITSAITLLEVLVKPTHRLEKRRGNHFTIRYE